MSTPLLPLLLDRIAADGPMNVAEYMATCLLHPEFGYYTTATPFGREGDFITAPEISQMFGELVGLCLAQAWMDQGMPSRFTLAELGPGRGTLMADLWRATARVPGFHAAAQLILVEASPQLRQTQAETLSHANPDWRDSVADLPEDQPLFLIANEFLDALPIRQFIRSETGWDERCIGQSQGALSFGRVPMGDQPELRHRLGDTQPGDIVETCPALPTIIGEVATRIGATGGTALWIDYGDWRSAGDTLQALRQHSYTDPLTQPGQADLTAHVDFEAVTRAAQNAHPNAQTSVMTSQGSFLEALGIAARCEALAAKLTGAARETHLAAYQRLTAPTEMGTLFKVVSVLPSSVRMTPGLAPWPSK